MVGWRVFLWAVLVVTALSFLWQVRGILPPFLLALVISALLEPLIERLCLRGWRRGSAVIAIFSSFLVVATLVIVVTLPAVVGQIGGFRDKFQGLVDVMTKPSPNDNFFVSWNPVLQTQGEGSNNVVDKLLRQNAPLLEKWNLPTQRQQYVQRYIEPQRANIGKSIEKFFGGLLGAASNLVSQVLLLGFTPLLVLMMLADMEQFRQRGIDLIPPSIREGTLKILGEIFHVFLSYLRGVSMAVLGYMLAMAVALSLMQVPYSIILGILFGAIYLIPYLNGLICMSILVLSTGLSTRTGNWLIELHNPWVFALLACATFFVTHIIYDSIIFPRLVGGSVGLHPVISMFVIFSGGALFGIVGMIIAFPLAGAIKVILDRLLAITLKPQDSLHLPAVPIRHRGTVT